MISISEFKLILETLPSIIIYIVPGYILLYTLNFLLSKEFKLDNISIFKSIVYSYIIVNIEQMIINIFNIIAKQKIIVDKASPLFINLTIVISIFIAYLITLFIKSHYFEKFLAKLSIKRTIGNNIFDDLKDDDNGVWVRAYISTEKIVYLGMLRLHEHNIKYDESFIVLSNYVSYAYGDCSIKEECFTIKEKSENWVALKVKDINRLEFVYDKKSIKIKKSS